MCSTAGRGVCDGQRGTGVDVCLIVATDGGANGAVMMAATRSFPLPRRT